jgi:hypothetical protein
LVAAAAAKVRIKRRQTARLRLCCVTTCRMRTY